MQITEIEIKLVRQPLNPNPYRARLIAFATVVFDDSLLIRDMKLIQGIRNIFVAMPSRRLARRCRCCSHKNHLTAMYCNYCGEGLAISRIERDFSGRPILHCDVAHPINNEFRIMLEARLIAAYEAELAVSNAPGYWGEDVDFGELDEDEADDSDGESGEHEAGEPGPLRGRVGG